MCAEHERLSKAYVSAQIGQVVLTSVGVQGTESDDFLLINDEWTFPSLSDGSVHFHFWDVRSNISFLFHFSIKIM